MKTLTIKKFNLALNTWIPYNRYLSKTYKRNIRQLIKETNSFILRYKKSNNAEIKKNLRYDIDRNCRFLLNYNHINDKIRKWANNILNKTT